MSRVVVSEAGGEVLVTFEPSAGARIVPVPQPSPIAVCFDAKSGAELAWYLEDYLYAPYGAYSQRGASVEARLERWGEELFEALFGAGKPGRAAYLQARGGALPPELLITSKSPRFLGLPWELLKDPERPTPLALDFVGFDRSLRSPELTAPTMIQTNDALRVLMIVARPAGFDEVRYRSIARPLLDRVEEISGNVEIHVLRPPTLTMLEAQLSSAAERGEPYHVLHFDGHGTFMPDSSGGSRRGSLRFENADGNDDPVPVDVFARVVRKARPPLIVLNACRSGMQDRRTEDTIATRLCEDGAASVVSMAYSVYVDAAADFMGAFYQALFDGKSVTEAVSAGRRRLRDQPLRPSPRGRLPLCDWIVPVHYLSSHVSFPGLSRADEITSPDPSVLHDAARGQRRSTGAFRNTRDQALVSVETFIGRDEEFFWLERTLRTQHVVIVHGFGGTGKTELAKGFARWWQRSGALDPQLVFFHSFEPGTAAFSLDSVLCEIGSALDPDFTAKTNGPAQRRRIILQLLRDHHALLIWDNFESIFSMPDPGRATPPMRWKERALVSRFLKSAAANSKGGIIITSRSDEQWLGPNPIERLRLSGLRREDAVELADSILEPYPQSLASRQHSNFEELLEWVDGHPLCLRLLLPQLEHKQPSTLLEELRGLTEHLPDGFTGPDRLRSLSVCIKYSLDHLHSGERDCLLLLALFDRVADADVLATFADIDGIPTRFAGISQVQWIDTLNRLAESGLLSPIGASMYQLHPALPAYLAAEWQATAGAAYESERAAVDGAMLVAYSRFGAWLYAEIGRGGADLAASQIDWQWHTMGRFASNALRDARYADAQALLLPLNWYFHERGLIEENRRWMTRCIRALKDGSHGAPVRDLETPASSLWYFAWSALGVIELAQNLDEARELYERLRDWLEALPETPTRQRSLAVVYQQLALVFSEVGQRDYAYALALKALAIAETGDDQAAIASAHYHIADVAFERGDLEAAEAANRAALNIYEDLGDVTSAGLCHHGLGILAQHRGESAEALRQYDLSYTTFQTVGNVQGMATAIYHKGRVAHALDNDLVVAEGHYRESLVLCERHGYGHGIGMSSDELGEIAESRDDLDAAEAWFMKALVIWESRRDHMRLAATYAHLAGVAQKRGDEAKYAEWLALANAHVR